MEIRITCRTSGLNLASPAYYLLRKHSENNTNYGTQTFYKTILKVQCLEMQLLPVADEMKETSEVESIYFQLLASSQLAERSALNFTSLYCSSASCSLLF